MMVEKIYAVEFPRNMPMPVKTLGANRPKIVVLCGSTRFKDEFIAANRREILSGNIVLSVGMFGHDEGIDMDGPVKKMLDQLHFRKIDLADEVYVIDPAKSVCMKCGKPTLNISISSDRPIHGECSECGIQQLKIKNYIGQSTWNEIQYAIEQGKPVRYLSKET